VRSRERSHEEQGAATGCSFRATSLHGEETKIKKGQARQRPKRGHDKGKQISTEKDKTFSIICTRKRPTTLRHERKMGIDRPTDRLTGRTTGRKDKERNNTDTQERQAKRKPDKRK
jgi:hypothetical protein